MLKKILLVMGLLAGIFSVQAQTWYLEDFESLSILGPNAPDGWEISKIGYSAAFQLHGSQGVDGSQALYAQVNQNEPYYFITQELGLGDEPVVEFQYKTTGIVGDAPANCLSMELSVIEGEDTTDVKTVSAEDFMASSTYATLKVALDKDAYAGKQVKVKLNVRRAGTDNVYFYIDNFGVGTKPEAKANDLMIQGEISGSSMPTVNTEAAYTFTVFNNGSEAQAAYSVQLLNATHAVLTSENITASIAAGATAQHTLKFTPTQTGADKLYAVVVLEGDEDHTNDTAALDIDVQAEGNTVVEVGKGSELLAGYPVDFTFRTNASLTLYTSEELNMLKGKINALMFEGKFSTEITIAAQIYVGETDLTEIPFDENYNAQFIDPANLTKVFDGNMTFQEGDHQSIRFDFTQPFAYSGEKNLAVYTFSRIAADAVLEDWHANKFYGVNVMRTIAISVSGDNIDPMKPNEKTGSPAFRLPYTKLFFSSVSDEKYSLTFAVKDASGNALTDAVITINGEKQEAGTYVFENMTPRIYSYMVEKEGYVPARGNLRLTSDTTFAVTLIDMEEYAGLTGYLFEDFENIARNKRPINWVGDFYVDTMGGKDNGHRLTHNFWYLDGSRSITTNPIFMGSNPIFELEYRVMGFDEKTMDGYTGSAFTGENLKWTVAVSEDFGQTWSLLHEEDYGEHQSSEAYKLFSVDVSDYAGKICQFKIDVERDYAKPDKFYFDIDNIKIGTQVENDLAIVSKIEGMRVPGAGAKTAYTVCVRNQGSVAAENYTLKFYDGQTEIGSVAGTKIESGAFTRLVYEHTFAQEGEHTLTARCEMEADEFLSNNITADFYVSVQPEGVRSSMVDAYEGEDISYHVPMRMYAKNSLSWLLYNRNDLALESGDNISGMAFRSKFAKETDRMHLVVYIGETNQNHMMTSVPVPASLTKVFDGGVTVGDKDGGNFVINFQRAYAYTGKNIVVAIYKEAAEAYSYNVDCGFYGYYSLDAVSAVAIQSDDEPIDLTQINMTEDEKLSAISLQKPSTIFLLNDNVSYHSVNFEVTDQNGQEVKNATVTFDGTVMAAGKYKVENVPDGTYAYSVSLNGETVSGELTVNGADVTEKVQLQHVANESNQKQTMVRIYPNPTDGKLHIDVAEGAREINLYDISGRSVRRINRVPAGIIELDMTDCHSGIYLLKIDNRAFKVSKR